MVCSEIALCVNNEINTNDISALEFEPLDKELTQVSGSSRSCGFTKITATNCYRIFKKLLEKGEILWDFFEKTKLSMPHYFWLV
jgi:hypothetical protein